MALLPYAVIAAETYILGEYCRADGADGAPRVVWLTEKQAEEYLADGRIAAIATLEVLRLPVRYRLKGASTWVTGKPVEVEAAEGTYDVELAGSTVIEVDTVAPTVAAAASAPDRTPRPYTVRRAGYILEDYYDPDPGNAWPSVVYLTPKQARPYLRKQQIVEVGAELEILRVPVRFRPDGGTVWIAAPPVRVAVVNGRYEVEIAGTVVELSTREQEIVAGAPGPVASLTVTPIENGLTVAITAPTSAGDGPIIDYEYAMSRDGGPSATVVDAFGTSTSPITISGLEVASYVVRVRAVNEVGVGPWTAAAAKTPLDVEPGNF